MPPSSDPIAAASETDTTMPPPSPEENLKKVRHIFGLANYTINQHLKDAATQAGLVIQQPHFFKNRYNVMHKDRTVNLDALSPSHIERDGQSFKAGLPFANKGLDDFLEFIHQPTRIAVERSFAGHPALGNKDFKREKQLRVHQILNFLTSSNGKITDQELLEEERKNGLNSCHEASESRQEENDAWFEQITFGASELIHDKHPETAVANSGIDLQKGFYIDINADVLWNDQNKTSSQRKLIAEVREVLQDCVEDMDAETTRLYFTADNLISFSSRVCHSGELARNLKNVLLDEQREIISEHVHHKIDLLGQDETFAERAKHSATPREQLKLMAQLSTALNPIIDPKIGDKVFAESHKTHQYMSPFSKIEDEYKQLNYQIQKAMSEPSPSQEDIQGILYGFSSLTVFTKKLAEATGNNEIAEAFDVIGTDKIEMAEEFLEPHHQQALEVVRKAMGKGKSPVKNMFSSMGTSILNVIKDTYEASTESKKSFAVASSILAAYIGMQSILINNPSIIKDMMENKNTQTAATAEANSDLPTVEEFVIFDIHNPDGLAMDVEVEDSVADTQALDANDTPEVCIVTHYHTVGTSVIPQCYAGEKLKDFSTEIYDWMDATSDELAVRSGILDYTVNTQGYETLQGADTSHFTNSARQASKDALNMWFYFNLAQFVAHGLFFYNMGRRGARQGLKAYPGAASLLGEFNDSMYHLAKYRPAVLPAMAATVAYGVTNDWNIAGTVMGALGAGTAGNLIQVQSGIYKDLMKIADKVKLPPESRTALDNMKQAIALSKQADEIKADKLPDNLKEFDLSLKIEGLKEQFKINKDNLGPTLEALKSFDRLMRNAAEEIGIEDPWEQRLIGQRLDAVTDALQDYGKDGDDVKLKTTLETHLTHVMGTEKRHSNKADIYKAIKGDEANPKIEQQLKKHGNFEHGKFARGQIILNLGNRLEQNPNMDPVDIAADKVVHSTVSFWDDMVGGYRKTKAGCNRIPHKRAWVAAAVPAVGTLIGIDMTNHTEEISMALSERVSDTINFLSSTNAVDAIEHTLNVSFSVSPEQTLSNAENIVVAMDTTNTALGTGKGYLQGTTIYGGYNIYEDLILNDFLGGVTALTAGVVGAYYGYGKIAKPTYEIAREIHYKAHGDAPSQSLPIGPI